MLAFYDISPLRLRGYCLYRRIGSGILSLLAVVIALLTLSIGLLAKNKLQGMICMKLTGLAVILPCIRLFQKIKWIGF